MICEQTEIINRLGLHARAAASFVKVAGSFKSEIFLLCKDQRVNGKSIMGIMMLAASQSTEIALEVDGTDENEAITALLSLIENRFGEED